MTITTSWTRTLIACAFCFATLLAARAEDIIIPGSGNPEYVVVELAKAFNESQTRHRVSVPTSTGTAGALRDLFEGKVSIGRVGRPLRDSESAKGLVYVPLGRDPVVFIAGAGVTVRNVTRAQMVDAYLGKLSNWSQLGGNPGAIRAVGREETDASRQAVAREIKAFTNIKFHDSVKVVNLDPQAIALMDRYPTSLGFLNRSSLHTAKTKLVPLALDGVQPTPENLAAGHYPLWLEFGLAYRKDALTEGGREFLRFVESPSGARVLRAYGILPPATRG